MSKIASGLWLGSIDEASSMEWLNSHNISHIVNCAIEIEDFFPKYFNYLHLGLYDSPFQELYNILEKSYNFILNAIKRGGNVLVHCYAGISRSSSIVSYFIMKIRGWNFKRTLLYLKNIRPEVSPNGGFIEQLMNLSHEYRPVKRFYPVKPIITKYNNNYLKLNNF